MNLEKMRDNINPQHSDLFIRMLKVNEVPEIVLKRYFLIKSVLDKVDGFLSATDLLRMAMDCGFNLETMRFETDRASIKMLSVPASREFKETVAEEDETIAKVEQTGLTASEAIYGFVGWLTARDEKTVMSVRHDSAPIVELCREFCKANNLAETREDWTENLIHPSGECSGPATQESVSEEGAEEVVADENTAAEMTKSDEKIASEASVEQDQKPAEEVVEEVKEEITPYSNGQAILLKDENGDIVNGKITGHYTVNNVLEYNIDIKGEDPVTRTHDEIEG